MEEYIRESHTYINSEHETRMHLDNEILYIDLTDESIKQEFLKNRKLSKEWVCIEIEVPGRLIANATPNHTGYDRVCIIEGIKEGDNGLFDLLDDRKEIKIIRQESIELYNNTPFRDINIRKTCLKSIEKVLYEGNYDSEKIKVKSPKNENPTYEELVYMAACLIGKMENILEESVPK